MLNITYMVILLDLFILIHLLLYAVTKQGQMESSQVHSAIANPAGSETLFYIPANSVHLSPLKHYKDYKISLSCNQK